jgi:hypothetical protein
LLLCQADDNQSEGGESVRSDASTSSVYSASRGHCIPPQIVENRWFITEKLFSWIGLALLGFALSCFAGLALICLALLYFALLCLACICLFACFTLLYFA